MEEKDFANPILMSIEKNSFALGGYRYCYKSTSCTILFNGKIWSIKKFNAAAKEYFASVRETGNFGYAEDRAKKTVQMHSLAQYLALKHERKSKREYGECFNYKRLFQAFFEENGQKRHIAIEEYLEGEFNKSVNNDGEICDAE